MRETLELQLTNLAQKVADMYQDRIPEATKNNITEIQEVMTDPNNAVVTNEFMKTFRWNEPLKQWLIEIGIIK